MQCKVELTLDSLLCHLKTRLNEISGNSHNDLQEIFYPEQSRSMESTFKSRDSLRLIEDFIGETASIASIGDSILFQEAEPQPIEFTKPLFRSASVTYLLDKTKTDNILS